MKRIFMFACLLVCTSKIFGQTDSLPVKDSFYELSSVLVKSIRLNNKAPFAKTNITAKEIQKQNLGQNLPYLLNQTPSVVVNSDDGIGVGYSSLRIRGSDMARINVTLNGIPVNDAESQAAIFVDLPDLASSTNSIQIQRGVGSSSNGAGAFGASVNISNIEQSKTAGATISNSYGSFNTWKHTVMASTGLLKGGFIFDVRLSKLNSSGYIDRAFSDLKSLQFIGSWTSKNDATNIKFNFLTGKERTGQAWNGLGVLFTDDDKAGFNYQKELDKKDRKTNTLGQLADGSYYNDQTDNYRQDYYQLFLTHKFNAKWSANISGFLTRGLGFYNEYKLDEAFADYGLPNFVRAKGDTVNEVDLVRQLWLDNYYYGTVFSTTYNTEKTNLIFGGGYTKYDGNHYGFVKWAEYGIPLDYKWYDLNAFKKDFNIYGKWQQQLVKGLYAFADVQFRNVDYDIRGFRKNPNLDPIHKTYSFINPKAGLSYLLYHANGATSKLYGSFSIANKEPNRDDFEASPDDLPKPEHLQDYEAGYEYNSPKFSAGLTGYYMNYKDQLILTGKINDVGAATRTNVAKSFRSGIELTAGVNPVDWLQMNANATFSWNKIKELTQYYDDYDNGIQLEEELKNTDIAFSPNTIAGLSVTFEPFYKLFVKQHFFIDVLEKYVSRQYLDNSSNKLRSINSYALTDLRLRYQLQTKSFKDISVILLINNVLDKKYENNGYTYSYLYDGAFTTENYYFPQAGTNWNIGLSFSF